MGVRVQDRHSLQPEGRPQQRRRAVQGQVAQVLRAGPGIHAHDEAERLRRDLHGHGEPMDPEGVPHRLRPLPRQPGGGQVLPGPRVREARSHARRLLLGGVGSVQDLPGHELPREEAVMVNTTILESYLHRTQAKRKPPERFSFTGIKASPIIVSFDQTLRATGVVVAQVSDHGKVWVLHHETIKTADPGVKSFEETYARTDHLKSQVLELLATNDDIVKAVIEQPPMGGGFRTESSTFAAYAVSRVCLA